MGKLEKSLFSFDYPEYKQETCEGWTWSLCPTWKEPFKECKQYYDYPCVMQRTSNFSIYVKLEYPDSLEPQIKSIINQCHKKGVQSAITVIATAAAAATVLGPKGTISAAIGAIQPAAEAYGNAFWNCLSSVSIPQHLKDQIKGNIYHRTKSLTNWEKKI